MCGFKGSSLISVDVCVYVCVRLREGEREGEEGVRDRGQTVGCVREERRKVEERRRRDGERKR